MRFSSMKTVVYGMAVCALALPVMARADNKAEVVSRGGRFELKKVLKAEGTTVLLFINETSMIEQQFLTDLAKQSSALRKLGADQAFVDAIGTGNIKNTKDVTFSPKDLALLKFVKLLTLNPSDTKDDDVEALREVGWTDEQIWEMGIEVGIFSFLNRMADMHGLDYPTSGWYPPGLREKIEHEKETQKETPPDGSAAPPSTPTDKKETKP